MKGPTGKLPPWMKGRDPAGINSQAQWSEDWTVYHTEGLRFVLRSGRFHPEVFVEGGIQKHQAECVLERPLLWGDFLAGRLLAGVGCELLLKGVYLKSGYSIRRPERDQPLAQRWSDADSRNDPFRSVTFSDAIQERNLRLINGLDFRVLWIAQEWRNEAAHAVAGVVGDAGVHLVQLGLAVFALHKRLLDGAPEEHRTDIEDVFSVTKPVFTRLPG